MIHHEIPHDVQIWIENQKSIIKELGIKNYSRAELMKKLKRIETTSKRYGEHIIAMEQEEYIQMLAKVPSYDKKWVKRK